MAKLVTRWNALRIMGRRDFHGVTQSAGTARKRVVELLGAHVPGAVLERVELLVSEVVTNAIVRSDSGRPDGLVTVCVGLGDDLIHVEVIDDGSATSVPMMRSADDDSLNGRGLGWVNLLSTAWSSGQDDEMGGAVWFQLTYDSPALP
ncbi:ATP-binding protein [Streptosporangium canum]|uniref:ATP-binding protein n=1 Tax=Streptosporangium canum TaxID=324952 RepID=UPI00343346CE